MRKAVKPRFRLYRRNGGTFYCHDNLTGKQESLGTRNRVEAQTLLAARNESFRQPALNLKIARVYLSATDPKIGTRTWQDAMDEMVRLKEGENAERWRRAVQSRTLDPIRKLPILETQPEDFLRVLRDAGVAANVYLRRVQNFVVDMNWLPCPVMPKRQWPKVRYQKRRGITFAEHQAILTQANNPERRAFYELAWHTGAAQSDLAELTAQNIDLEHRVIRFHRKKTRSACILSFSEDVATILETLPRMGLLFPAFHALGSNHRATEFRRACRRAGVVGVSLHCYRYAWAERAKSCGYPERFAQVALGHNSRAVHESYASGASPVLPALDDYERAFAAKVVSMHGRMVAS
jgi:integrase